MDAYFGRPRTAVGFRSMIQIPTPVGQPCIWCNDPIHPDDDGVRDHDDHYWHADCWLLQLLRKVSADAGEIEGVPRREAARRVVGDFEREGRL